MKLCLPVLRVLLLIVTYQIADGVTSLSPSDWMKAIGDNTKLVELSIPGTHDAASYDLTNGEWGECQDWNIRQQLENGIRFFDIRVSNSHRSNNRATDFELRHGPLRLGSFENLVMNPVVSFLNSHPKEVILMKIKRCHGCTLDDKRLTRDFVKEKTNKYKFYQKKVDASTTLGHVGVRGKIILFNYYTGNINIGVMKSEVETKKSDDQWKLDWEYRERKIFWWSIRVKSGLDYPGKARKVIKMLDAQNLSKITKFWVNSASANWNGLYYKQTAKVVNGEIKSYLDKESEKTSTMIIEMDYPNKTPGVIQSIIDYNMKPACDWVCRKKKSKNVIRGADFSGGDVTHKKYYAYSGYMCENHCKGYPSADLWMIGHHNLCWCKKIANTHIRNGCGHCKAGPIGNSLDLIRNIDFYGGDKAKGYKARSTSDCKSHCGTVRSADMWLLAAKSTCWCKSLAHTTIRYYRGGLAGYLPH